MTVTSTLPTLLERCRSCPCGWKLTCGCGRPTHIRIIPPGPGEEPAFSEFAVTCPACHTPHWMRFDLEEGLQ